MGDIMTTTFIRKIMKGKKIMQKETKKERFDRISEARKIKILDGIRLLENCSNKSNYEYTNDESLTFGKSKIYGRYKATTYRYV